MNVMNMCAKFKLNVILASGLTFITLLPGFSWLTQRGIEKEGLHYVNASILINFSQKTSVFTVIIISSP